MVQLVREARAVSVGQADAHKDSFVFLGGLYRLISTATLAVRLERSTDSEQQDFKFQPNGRIGGIAGWAGSGTAYVAGLYDQVTGTYFPIQATAGQRPYIDVANYRIVCDDDTVTRSVTEVLGSPITQPFSTVFAGTRVDGLTTLQQAVWINDDAAGAALGFSATANTAHLSADGSTIVTAPADSSTRRILIGVVNGASSGLWVDGFETAGDAGTGSLEQINAGGNEASATNRLQGWFDTVGFADEALGDAVCLDLTRAIRNVRVSHAGYLAEARTLLDYLDSQSVGVNSVRAGYMNTLMAALMEAGVWPILDCLWLMASATDLGGRVNWRAPGTRTISKNGSPTFTADYGFSSASGVAGTTWLDTGYNPTSHGARYTQNAAHAALWCIEGRGTSSADRASFGNAANATAEGVHIYMRNNSGGNNLARINTDTTAQAASISTSVAAQKSFVAVQRTSSTVTDVYRNGASIASNNSYTASGLPNASLYIMKRNGDTNANESVFAMCSVGGAMTAAQHLAYYNAVRAYLISLGNVSPA